MIFIFKPGHLFSNARDPNRDLDQEVQVSVEQDIAAMEHREDVGEVNDPRVRPTVIFSPTLDGLTLDMFPDGFVFGNGLTISNVPIKVSPDSAAELTGLGWCVFPDSEIGSIRSNVASLCQLTEI